MFTDTAKKAIEEAINAELTNCKEHGQTYNTEHEAYAVTKEELEELQSACILSMKNLDYLWEKIKMPAEHVDPNDKKRNIETIQKYAINAALEAVQVAACCRKSLKSYI